MLGTSLRSTVQSSVEEMLDEMQMNASLFHADDAEAYVFPHWRELLGSDARSNQERSADARN